MLYLLILGERFVLMFRVCTYIFLSYSNFKDGVYFHVSSPCLGFAMSLQRFKKEEVAVFNWPVCGNVAKSLFEIWKSVECQVTMKTYIRFLMKSEHARLEDVTFCLVSFERHRI